MEEEEELIVGERKRAKSKTICRAFLIAREVGRNRNQRRRCTRIEGNGKSE